MYDCLESIKSMQPPHRTLYELLIKCLVSLTEGVSQENYAGADLYHVDPSVCSDAGCHRHAPMPDVAVMAQKYMTPW